MYSYDGEWKADYKGLFPFYLNAHTGKRFRCRMAAIFQFADAGLVGARIYYDTGTIARQLA